MSRSTRPRTLRQKLHFQYCYDRLKQLEWDVHQRVARDEAIPEAWREIARQAPRAKKVRISMWVEEDVVKFFKSLGHPYQPRMNDVLKGFMHAKIAGLTRETEFLELAFHLADTDPRPELGGTAALEDRQSGRL